MGKYVLMGLGVGGVVAGGYLVQRVKRLFTGSASVTRFYRAAKIRKARRRVGTPSINDEEGAFKLPACG